MRLRKCYRPSKWQTRCHDLDIEITSWTICAVGAEQVIEAHTHIGSTCWVTRNKADLKSLRISPTAYCPCRFIMRSKASLSKGKCSGLLYEKTSMPAGARFCWATGMFGRYDSTAQTRSGHIPARARKARSLSPPPVSISNEPHKKFGRRCAHPPIFTDPHLYYHQALSCVREISLKRRNASSYRSISPRITLVLRASSGLIKPLSIASSFGSKSARAATVAKYETM